MRRRFQNITESEEKKPKVEEIQEQKIKGETYAERRKRR